MINQMKTLTEFIDRHWTELATGPLARPNVPSLLDSIQEIVTETINTNQTLTYESIVSCYLSLNGFELIQRKRSESFILSFRCYLPLEIAIEGLSFFDNIDYRELRNIVNESSFALAICFENSNRESHTQGNKGINFLAERFISRKEVESVLISLFLIKTYRGFESSLKRDSDLDHYFLSLINSRFSISLASLSTLESKWNKLREGSSQEVDKLK
ncbi:MAG: hypothetical protein WD751_07615 [Anaerolineales bacterium]